jgi:hypothetical protein
MITHLLSLLPGNLGDKQQWLCSYHFYLSTLFNQVSQLSLGFLRRDDLKIHHKQKFVAPFHSLRRFITFHSRKRFIVQANMNLPSPQPLCLASGNTGELEFLSSSVSVIKPFFLKLIACSPGDLSHFFWSLLFSKAHWLSL